MMPAWLFIAIRLWLFFLEVLIAIMMFSRYFTKRSYFWLRLILCSVGIMLVGIGLGFLTNWILENTIVEIFLMQFFISFISTIIVFMLTVVLMFVCYSNDRKNVIISSMFGYCCQHATYSLYSILVKLMGEEYVLFNYAPISFVKVAIYLIVYACCYLTIRYVIARRLGEQIVQETSNKIYILFAFTLLVNIIIGKGSEVYNMESLYLYVLLLACQAICCIFILLSQYFMFERIKMQNEKQVIEHLLYRQADQYKLLKKNSMLLNIKVHDLKYQLTAIETDKIDKNLFKETKDAIAIFDSIAKTDNEVLNVILTEKWLYCDRHNIRLSCIVDPDSLNFIEATDVSSLIGNALDNAIEAVMKLSEKDKRAISLSISKKNGLLNIQTNNYFDAPLNFENGVPKTSKKDSVYHGYGLKSIKYIANKYGGVMHVRAEKDIFTLQVSLPLPENNYRNQNMPNKG